MRKISVYVLAGGVDSDFPGGADGGDIRGRDQGAGRRRGGGIVIHGQSSGNEAAHRMARPVRSGVAVDGFKNAFAQRRQRGAIGIVCSGIGICQIGDFVCNPVG